MRYVLCAIASVSGVMLRCRTRGQVPQFQVVHLADFVGFAQTVLVGVARPEVVIVVVEFEVRPEPGLWGGLATCASPARQAARGG